VSSHSTSSTWPVRAAAGDLKLRRTALEDEVVGLFDQFRDRLLRYLLGLGLSIQDSEEVVQEVFLSLFQHLERDKSRENIRGWLFRVAHNLGLKRRERLRRTFEVSDESALAIDPAPSQEQKLVEGQTQRRLWLVVEALPEQDRRCLLLRAEGLRYREIAEVLGISLGGVSLSLTRTLSRLARAAER
jgi:RNA polymerase sigma-70 factor (ECF subfamily)